MGIKWSTPNDFTPYRITEDEGGIGTQSPRGMIEVQGDLIILEDSIPRRYSTSIQATGVLKPQEIALPIKDAWLEEVNTNSLLTVLFSLLQKKVSQTDL